VRCLENSADGFIRLRRNILRNGALKDSLLGNWDGYYQKLDQIRRFDNLLNSRDSLKLGAIQYHEMFEFMVDNAVYSEINMNTFNFIRAVFSQLLWRLPTEQEYNQSFDMIEFNLSRELFGNGGSDRNAFIDIVIESNGMLEGMIIWAYQSFLNREPLPEEVTTLMIQYSQEKNIDYVINQILATDEYANFR